MKDARHILYIFISFTNIFPAGLITFPTYRIEDQECQKRNNGTLPQFLLITGYFNKKKEIEIRGTFEGQMFHHRMFEVIENGGQLIMESYIF